jgi:hypothetical protein
MMWNTKKSNFIFLFNQHSVANDLRTARVDAPDADLVVGVSGEQGRSVSRPGEGNTLGVAGLLGSLRGVELGDELVNLGLLLEVEDDDGGGGGSAEPVAVRGEDKGVDLVTSVEGVEVLGLVEVPEHGGSVLSSGSAEGSVGGDGDGVDVSGVSRVVGLDAAGRELPNLKKRLLINVPVVYNSCILQKTQSAWFQSGNW